MEANQSVEKISWMPHSMASGVKIKPLISQKEHKITEVTEDLLIYDVFSPALL